jgi:hypothetical protein
VKEDAMLLDLAIERGEVLYNIFAEKSFTTLLFSCANGGSCTIEIGQRYVFSRGYEQGLERCGLKLRIMQRSSLTDENIAIQGLNQERIGRLGFYPALSPVLLEASVFLDDQVFNRLLNSLEMQKGMRSALLSITGEEILKFHLPDWYSWRIDNEQEPSYVYITRLEIPFLLFEHEGTS